MLEHKKRYIQLAFNGSAKVVERILPTIPLHECILIEAGTPYIKREGLAGIQLIREHWQGNIVADLKTHDGAIREVYYAHTAGATAATVSGSASVETINIFIQQCAQKNMTSMIDMLGVQEPLAILRALKHMPHVVILHRGRDEETTRGKTIPYKHINKIKSKYGVLISAAGGVDLKEACSAIFNGANIVVVNIISSGDPWTGIKETEDVAAIAQKFLRTIE